MMLTTLRRRTNSWFLRRRKEVVKNSVCVCAINGEEQQLCSDNKNNNRLVTHVANSSNSNNNKIQHLFDILHRLMGWSLSSIFLLLSPFSLSHLSYAKCFFFFISNWVFVLCVVVVVGVCLLQNIISYDLFGENQ